MAEFQMIRRSTLLSYLNDYLQRGDAIMFTERRGLRLVHCTYKQLVQTARRLARELEVRGIAPGERIILCGKNSFEWVAAFWGSVLRGAVVVPLDEESTEEFVLSVQQQTEPKLVVASSGKPFLDRLHVPILILERLSEEVGHHSAAPYPTDRIDEGMLVEIIFTSGTTSKPKGVMLTHRNLLANLLPLEAEIKRYMKWERFFHPIRFLNLVPLSHVFGQFMAVFVPQLLGGEVHFHDTLNPAQIVRRARESRVSVMVLVPRLLDSLREWLERDYGGRHRAGELQQRIALSAEANVLRRWWTFRLVHQLFGWKFWAFLSGGATLDERTETFWRRIGFAVLQGYGMTETASMVTVTHPFKGSHGSVGRLMPGYEVNLDESGEISVRGAAVSPGYWNGERSNTNQAEEWLQTGDIGALDVAGNLYFKGRSKDVIVMAPGLNVYPEDLEQTLNLQPEVRTSCVIKWEGPRGSEPLAVLIFREPNVSAETVVEHVNQALAEHQQIRRWFVWTAPDFPRTPTHKVLKGEVATKVKQQYDDAAKNHGEALTAVMPSSFIISQALRISGNAAPVQSQPTLKLTTDLKLDSLGRIELLSALEDHYQVEIDEAAFTAATSVGDIERIVRGEVEERGAPYPYPKWALRFPVTWIRTLLFYTVILPITKVMSRVHVEGSAHLRSRSEPVLFVANHVTLADHALVLAGLPARMRHRLAIAMEGERLRGWLYPSTETRWFMRLRFLLQYLLVITFFHVFPLPKQSGFRRSFAFAGECVDRGESVLVFPEGERAPRGQMHLSSFKTGIGLLAKELNVAVVPVKLHGLYELKARQQYFAPPGLVRVVFGEPVKFDAAMEPAEIAAELEQRVAAL